jgi:hypothetical protein
MAEGIGLSLGGPVVGADGKSGPPLHSQSCADDVRLKGMVRDLGGMLDAAG